MSGFPRLLVFGVLVAILVTLGSALYHLSRPNPESGPRMARSLTWRIGLSVALFLLLMLLWYAGVIHPHDLGPPPAPPR